MPTPSVWAMDVILIPGFWLDGASWGAVTPTLERAGHRVHALTLPGLESPDADRRGITLRDHIDAVVAVVDRCEDKVVVAGHSGGGAIAYAVADARPDRIARVVYVDSAPLPHGRPINDDLSVVDGEIPLPEWSEFEEIDLRDLSDELRASFRARAVPQPAAVANDPLVLADERRYDVPATVIACEFSSDVVRDMLAQGHPMAAELGKIRDVELVDVPTGHWPQFTKPAELAEAILRCVERS
ncbi:alpha/beta hydrolase [Saccharomonospora xinjiangensis]|nr:Pyrethroid hydrolase [Saccharomonospora xinjiangensis]